MVAVIEAILGLLQAGIHQSHTTEQPDPFCRLTVNAKLDTAVALFSGRTENFGLIIQIEFRLFKLKRRQAGAVVSHINFDAGFNLLGACRFEDFIAVIGRQRGCLATSQPFNVIGVQRHIFQWLEYHAKKRRNNRFVVI